MSEPVLDAINHRVIPIAWDGPPDQTRDGEPVFDHRDALRRLGGDQEELLELIGLFLEIVPPQRAHLHEAFSRNDVGAMRDIAHRMKGAAGNMAALQLSRAALELERSARDSSADLPACLRELDVQMDRLEEVMQSFRANAGVASDLRSEVAF